MASACLTLLSLCCFSWLAMGTVHTPRERLQRSSSKENLTPCRDCSALSSTALVELSKPQYEDEVKARNKLKNLAMLLMASNPINYFRTRLSAPQIARPVPTPPIDSSSDSRAHLPVICSLRKRVKEVIIGYCVGVSRHFSRLRAERHDKALTGMRKYGSHMQPNHQGTDLRGHLGTALRGGEVGATKQGEVLWLNTIIAEMWPKLTSFVEKTVKEEVEPLIQGALPHALSGAFSFSEVELGENPLELASIEASQRDYVGRHGMLDEIRVKLHIVYHGSAVISISAAGAKLGIQNIQLEGELTIVLQELLEEPPFFSGISIFFANTPSIKLSWSGAASVLYLFEHHVHNVICKQIDSRCVLPKRIAMVLNNTEPEIFRITAPRPSGCLRLQILRARNLKGADWHLTGKATSDPYAKLSLSGKEHQSKTVEKTCDPQWEEEAMFFVFDQDQNFSLKVMDSDFGKHDDFLGFLSSSVADVLAKCAHGPAWFLLGPNEEVNAHAKVQGEVQLMANWMPISIDRQKVSALEAPGSRPQALLFLGLYSVKVPPAQVGTPYTIEVSCNGESLVVEKKSERTGNTVESIELKDNIAKLRSLKVKDKDIADVLSIPIEALSEKDPVAASYSRMVNVREPFLWLIDVPKNSTISIEVAQGDMKLASFQVDAIDCLNNDSCTIEETLKNLNGNVEVNLIAQVRAITET